MTTAALPAWNGLDPAFAALGSLLAEVVATTRDAWRGIDGFLEDAGIEARRMQPSVVVWRRVHGG